MKPKVSPREFACWQDYIHQRCGVMLGREKAYLIEHRLGDLLAEYKCEDFGQLYRKMKFSGPGNPLRQAVLDRITTGETFWFRDMKLFDLLIDSTLPDLYSQKTGQKDNRIRLWSAACSTGQEPFSLAMACLTAYETMGGERACREQVRILATDISEASLEVGRSAVYDEPLLSRGLSPLYRARFFKPRRGRWQVREDVRRLVRFNRLNLCSSFSGLGPFDLVFLRNVIIYFSDQAKERLITRLAEVMKPCALLFLGAGEILHPFDREFETVRDNGLVYYRLKDRAGRVSGS